RARDWRPRNGGRQPRGTDRTPFPAPRNLPGRARADRFASPRLRRRHRVHRPSGYPDRDERRRLRRRLRALAPDVVHTHNEKAHIRGAFATLGMRRAPALVHTRHGESRATGWAALANRLAVWRSGFLISVSEQASAIAR